MSMSVEGTFYLISLTAQRRHGHTAAAVTTTDCLPGLRWTAN